MLSESNPNIVPHFKGSSAFTGEFGEIQRLWLHRCHPLRIPSLHQFLPPQVPNTLKSLAPRKLYPNTWLLFLQRVYIPLITKSFSILSTKPIIFENDIWKVTSNCQIQNSLTFNNSYSAKTHVSRCKVFHVHHSTCDLYYLLQCCKVNYCLSINSGKIWVI